MKKSKTIINYWDLGRNNEKGDIEVTGTADEINRAMYREFSKHLLSSDISFDDGKIFAGFRTVGNYTVVAKEIIELEK